ncbi:factor activating pos9 [Tulasnella sp. 419]|nr:factor activating pos9 [Tulasnella sp. 418]KAG8961572.1 factor activating pos9 [Tulasnella sp. 419]
MDTQQRRSPIIIVTGTPGTGKTTHAQALVDASPVPLRHLNIGELVKDRKLHEGFDEEWQSYIVDDDKVLDEIEPLVDKGGLVLDWHTCGIFPERWIDLVVVLRCDHTMLWERLEKRQYPLKKIQENNEAEIMQTVLDEARESYAEEIIVELQSEGTSDLESNVARITAWVEAWRRDRGFVDGTEEGQS